VAAGALGDRRPPDARGGVQRRPAGGVLLGAARTLGRRLPVRLATFSDAPFPGEIRKISYQQLAHGADAQIWFRWRTATAGREQYWHGLLGHDGRPLRRYREAAQVAREYRQLEKALEGTTVAADVAIIYDYESIWSLASQPGYAGNDSLRTVARYYDALFRAGVNTDLISPEADLSGYKLVFAPDLAILPDARARKLTAFVERVGVLLADARTGVKDENNLAHERTLPGLLSDILGITIEEYGDQRGCADRASATSWRSLETCHAPPASLTPVNLDLP
jgi:beta-galactosidase